MQMDGQFAALYQKARWAAENADECPKSLRNEGGKKLLDLP